MQAANDLFGTPGRTAAQKSPIREEDLVEVEDRARTDIQKLRKALADVRARHREMWLHSPRREALLAEWREALGGGNMGKLEMA